jgi:uncharacterized membrane protein YhaH (DUF805 family)
MFLPLKRYADFDGRSPRIEYWMFTLFTWIVIIGLGAITFALAPPNDLSGDPAAEVNPMFGLPLVLIGLFYLAILIPSIAVTVRRLHDRDMSGWFYLINFVPYVGGFIIFIFMVLPGTEGENSYGENPLDEDGNHPDQLEQIFT